MTINKFKGSYLFLDWCPSFSGVSCPGHIRHDRTKVHEKLESIIKQVESDSVILLESVEVGFRDDGIILFFVTFRQHVEKPEIFDVSRRLSLKMKSECFGHKHVHHSGEDDIIANHYPIFCEPATQGQVEAGDSILEICTALANDDQSQKRQDIIDKTLSDDTLLCTLRASNRRFEVTNQLAPIELKNFLGGKHKRVLNDIDGIRRVFNRKGGDIRIEALGILLITTILTAYLSYLAKPNADLFCFSEALDASNLLRGTFCGVIGAAFWNYYRVSVLKSRAILRVIGESIGFLHRASTYCNRISTIYQRLQDRSDDDHSEIFDSLTFTPPNGYHGFIGSLEVFRDRYKLDLERRLVTSGIVIALIALVATIITN